MSSILIYPFIIVAGMMQAFGNSMNGQLNKSLQNPWLASLVSFGLIVAVTACVFAVLHRPLPSSADIGAMPWWAPLGGIVGAVAVFAGLTLVNTIGAGPVNGLTVTANIIASLAIDHFGLLNMPVHAINPWRVAGGILMVCGVALIARF